MSTDPSRIPRDQHPISRKHISNAALKVLYGLKEAGFEAYLVGGAVRDLLAGIRPKDFDVATNAKPEDMRRIFRTARAIGRRFVITHVRFGGEIIEVTTFRGAISEQHARDDTGRILSDNEYGTLETDAFRRDFTANALYYDISDFSIVDYTGGAEDVAARQLRLIGEPDTRYREDPVRMLRAVRLANKLNFAISPETAEPITRLAPLLAEVPAARHFDEIIKLLLSTEAVANFRSLRSTEQFAVLFPTVHATLKRFPATAGFIEAALANTANRIAQDQPVTPAFMYAALLWPAVAERYLGLMQREGQPITVALAGAGESVLAETSLRVMIPRRFGQPMREIWDLQPRFEQRRGNKPRRLMTHPRFKAAYDFLLLRAQTGDANPELATWWTAALEAHGPLQPVYEDADPDAWGGDGDAPADAAGAERSGPPRRRRRRR